MDAARKVGVEIEFAGLDTIAAAEVLKGVLGGTVQRASAYRAFLRESRIGDVEIELDTRYAHDQGENATAFERAIERLGARDALAGALASVTPVEVVTPPLSPEGFDVVEEAVAALRAAGAEGTDASPIYAFGMHLNVELKGGWDRAVRIAAAYAFAERWIRERWRVDPWRRVPPFIDPYPRGYIVELGTAMADGAVPGPEPFIRLYQTYNPSRNRGLDMWPLLGHLEPGLSAGVRSKPVENPRRAFHYRLPDSRVGQDGWSPRVELARWDRLEAAADRPERLEEMRRRAVATESGEGLVSRYMEALDRILA